MTYPTLFSPARIGALTIPNRVVMAPMTRLRASEGGTPTPEMVEYYRQRASAGLIVSEGIWPSTRGQSEWRVPGLECEEHVVGWRLVVAAVHAAGGSIFAQLMHGGRNGHPQARIDGSIPAGPSAVRAPDDVHLPDGSKAPAVTPLEMSEDDIEQAVADYVVAARNAMRAGFDGVEIHSANSYLPHQFLADNTNLRTDGYGGSVNARIRFPLEVVRRVAAEIGAARTAIRLSPGNPQFGMREDDPAPTYRELVARLDMMDLAYLHLTDGDDYAALADLRGLWRGILVANIGENREATTRAAAERVLAAGLADAVSFGRGFLSNPDLPERLARDIPWNPIDIAHLYTPGPRGYTDYASAAREFAFDGDLPCFGAKPAG